MEPPDLLVGESENLLLGVQILDLFGRQCEIRKGCIEGIPVFHGGRGFPGGRLVVVSARPLRDLRREATRSFTASAEERGSSEKLLMNLYSLSFADPEM